MNWTRAPWGIFRGFAGSEVKEPTTDLLSGDALVYFLSGWPGVGHSEVTQGNPIGNLLRFLILGEGDVAPIAHEVLRRAIPDPKHRPVIHVS